MMQNNEENLKKLFKQLDNSAATPSREWLVLTRQRLQRHMQANTADKAEKFISERPSSRSWWLQPVGVMAAVALAVLALGGGTVYVAQGAEPGETLYPLKIASENFSVFVNVSPGAKAKLYLKYADRRFEELEKLYEKESGSDYWQEKVIQNMGEQIISAKDSMSQLEEEPEFADVALEFDLFTEKQDQQIIELQARLNTTTNIISRAQELNEMNKSKALEALEKAQAVIKENQAIRGTIKQKIDARLELLHARQKAKFEEKNKNRKDDPINIQINGKLIELDNPSDDEGPEKEEINFEDDGVHFKSEVEVESEGQENIETEINVNDGQTIINSTIQATGTSIYINESSKVVATSSSQVEIKGSMTDWRDKFFKDFQEKFGNFKFSDDFDNKNDKPNEDRDGDKDD